MLSALRSRLDRCGPRSDDGVSLIELTVAMVVGMIVLAGATTFFINVINTSSAATVTTTNADQARITLDSWAGLLAVADSPTTPGSATGRITNLTSTNLTFYANIGNRAGTTARTAPTLVSLSITNGQLVEARTANGATTTRYLAGCLTSNAASNTGCVSSGRVGPTSTGFTGYTSCAGAQCTALSGTNYASVTAVGISFTMIDTHGGATQTYSTLATLPAASS